MLRRALVNFNLCLTLFLFVVLTFTASARVVRPYEPNIADPLLDAWRWQHIKRLDGLSFQCMTQDPNGVMWFGLRNGVLCYNGHRWWHYRRTDNRDWPTRSILATKDGRLYARMNGTISHFTDNQWKLLLTVSDDSDYSPGQALAEDAFGTVWAATRKGLVRISDQEAALYQPVAGGITTVFVDSANNLWWLGPGGSEFHVVPLRQGQFAPAAQRRSFPLYTKNNKRKACLTQTRDGRIWIGSHIAGENLHIYDPRGDTWTHVAPEATGNRFACTDMVETRDNTLWTIGSGSLRAFKDGHWKVYDPPQARISSLQSALLETSDGALWIGNHKGRLSRVEYSSTRCLSYHGLHFQCDNAAGRRWFLTEAGTVVSQSMDGNAWEQYDKNDDLIDTPVVVIATRDGSVWAAGSHVGEAAVSRFDGTRWNRRVFPELGYGISHYSVFETMDGDALFGNATNQLIAQLLGRKYGGGILRFRQTAQGYDAEHVPYRKLPYLVVGIAETTEGLWFGGKNLAFFDGHTKRDMEDSLDLPVGWVDHVINTRDGRGLWVAKGGEGLFAYDGHSCTHYSVEDGLASNMVCWLCEHPDGTMLAATSNGISRFDGELWQTLILPEAFRLDRESGSMHVTASEDIWINQTERAWYFRALAGTIPLEPIDSLFVTSRYRPDANPPDTTIIPLVNASSTATSVAFTWTGQDAWDSTPQEHLRYSYRIDNGLWSPFFPRTRHMLSDLSVGRHVFEVRARDRDFNVDPQPASITFTVIAPVWRQGWFILLIGALVTTIAILTVYLVRSRMDRATQQLQLEKQQAQQQHAVDESRLAFFTNISHELRTPLTLILGPLETILSKSKLPESELRAKVALAKRNASRLLKLVNQLLDMRKLQEGRLQFNPTEDDIIRFAERVTESMRPAAERKQLTLEFSALAMQLTASFDPDKLEKILVNLISNAIKFTPAQGHVTVTVKPGDKTVELTVEDTGVGVSPDQLEHVFERFYRVDDSSAVPGSGIGLSLVKELVHLHSGTISAVSPANPTCAEHPGTRFIVQLPGSAASSRESSEQTRTEPVEQDDADQTPKVLLVEDNEDMRLYVGSILTEQYRLVEAGDGQVALEMARKHWPDLIVSDVMMPRMDGLELCRTLKTDENTSHIPVILLTAKGSKQAQVAGLETGADDYIVKPFSSDVLLARVRNLLESRRRLRERFSRGTLPDPKEITVTSTDEQFLQKAMDVLEEHMGDCEFDVDAFAEMMPMSRSWLYRKIKALTGQSPSVFIRSIRVKRAATLLETGEFNVSEVAYRVGFMDMSYFGARFKDQFQCTPSQYRAEHCPKDEAGSSSDPTSI